jgi:hypothetical protein
MSFNTHLFTSRWSPTSESNRWATASHPIGLDFELSEI